jgi:threonine dehydratase
MATDLPTAADIAAAATRLRDWVFETPVLESAVVNELAGRRVLLKAECLQRGGSFKLRGALNRMLQLGAHERAGGVVAFSSGNHAQAVALAAKWLGMPATIVMPADAPRIKQESTRRWGAEVVLYDRERDDRERLSADIAAERGAALVPPFDHRDIVTGQGTAGLELAATARARGAALAALYVPCSGGGLVAGCALATHSVFPDCAVYAVEPSGNDDHALSLRSGEPRKVERQAPTICDGLRAPLPGAITFAVNKRELAGAVAVDDDEVKHAMAVAARHLKVVLEPSGAAAFAAALRNTEPGDCVGVILSGGNVDDEVLRSVLAIAD